MHIVESNTRSNCYSLEYYADHDPKGRTFMRHVEFLVRIGDSADRGRLVQQEEGPPRPMLPEGPMSPREVADAGPPSPIAEIPDDKWELLMSQPHNKNLVDALEREGHITIRHQTDAKTTRRSKAADKG